MKKYIIISKKKKTLGFGNGLFSNFVQYFKNFTTYLVLYANFL